MNQLNSLANPNGWGIVLAFWWYVTLSLAATSISISVFRRHPSSPTKLEVFYLSGVSATLGLYAVLVFYAPRSLRENSDTTNYESLANLLSWVGLAGFAALLPLIITALAAFTHRHENAWHWPFLWLVAAQVVLTQYVLSAMADRKQTYDYRAGGYARTEAWTPWEYWLMLGVALVLTVVAVGNMVLSRRALRMDYSNQVVRRYMEQKFHARTTGDEHKSVQRGKLGFVLSFLLPFKVYWLHRNWNASEPAAEDSPERITALDRLVASLAALYGVQPPWDFSKPDNPDDENPEDGLRRDINRT